MRVLGLDLSCESSGVALPDGSTLTITAPKAAGKKRTLVDDLTRLEHINRQVRDVLDAHHPVDLAVIEDYAPGIRSSAAHRLAEVGGIVRLACWQARIPVVLIGTKQVKQYATGKGTAEKSDMRMALYKRADIDNADDNQVDAWWLRAMALDAYGEPVCVMPAVNRTSLDKVVWPAVPTYTPTAVPA